MISARKEEQETTMQSQMRFRSILRRAGLGCCGLWVLCTLLSAQAAPLAAEDPYTTGRRFFDAANYKQAALMFEAAMRLNPAHSSALFFDALCYQRLGETEHARALYQHVINVFPRSSSATAAARALNLLPAAGSAPAASAATVRTAVSAASSSSSSLSEAAQIDANLKTAADLIAHRRESEAEHLYLESERKAERLGNNSTKLGEVLGTLGDFYAARGDNDKACSVYRRELHIRELTIDRRSVEFADCMTRQAPAYMNDGQLEQAEQLLQRSMDTYQRAYDASEREHTNSKPARDKLTGCMSQLAQVWRKQNRVNDAKQLEYQVKLLSP
jgi:tetratricopeptide (TPR) repeat protein